ncbi:serine/threonine protein kinase [Kitasatospora sp. NBC_00240]|uniref:serine/threonine-protein kinase n=1 Tax=Kitasatospora sp. NBC_00240 TaxID=2903567 RepID=UPI00224CBCE9|nr:serine/threonine-protein kinase [Kitasatospora sp. NBC_00240]MCX5215135.1 serine/threonine protein kinase [Kitasatospora sp. NBC_00240]
MTTGDRTVPLPSTFQPLSADDPREVGGYRVFARLGAGGMGRVYLSYTRGGRPVAIKVVRPELAEDTEFRHRFAREVASARRIHGLYTAQVVDSGVDAAQPWLATAYVAGPSLQQVVDRFGALPERTVLLIIAGIAEALQAIHATDVVHRDLKPANVLIAADGPRVIDFGIARAADTSALTSTGLRIGSPGFMAPEQVLGQPAGPATDVFALGALAFYVSTGTPPFGGGPESATMYRAVHEDPDFSRVPAGLRPLLRQCLAKDPARRPGTLQIIESARSHAAVGGHLRFADDWLPHPVSTEIRRRADLPTAIAGTNAAGPAPTGPATTLDPIRAATAEAPTALTPATALAPAPAPAPGPAPAPAPADEPGLDHGRDRHRGSGRRRTALTATAALLIGAVGATALLLTPLGDDSAGADTVDDVPTTAPTTAPPAAPTTTAPSTPLSTPTAPTAGPGFTPVYAEVELTSPDPSYEFDIKAGRVAPQENATWYLGRSATEFFVPEDSDTFIAPGGRLTPEDCVKGIESRPATALPFTTLGAGRAFCVRSRAGHDIAVVRVLAAGAEDGAVRISMDYYRQDG